MVPKKIVIIGASSGLGARIASDFARVGLEVAIAARREDRLKEIASQFPAGRIVYKTIDVTATDAVERFYDLIEQRGGMDVLLYAAGTGFYDPDLNLEKLQTTLNTNVMGFAKITAAAYKYFKSTADSYRGQIAVITSVAGTKGIGVAAAYSSSKRFQQMFIDSLDQLAHAQHVDLDFTDIRPGFIRTDLLDVDKQYPMIMSIDYAAPRIEEAILRRRRVAVIDWRWGIVNSLWRLIPGVVWRRLSISL